MRIGGTASRGFAACLAALVPSVAAARGIEVGLRAGYAVPYGYATDRVSLPASVLGKFPLILDAGFRFGDRVYAGFLGEIAYGLPRGCDPGATCSVQDYRIAFNGQLHLRKDSPRVDPWVGIGFGYEFLHQSRAGAAPGPSDENLTLHGIHFLIAQAGCDFHVAPRFAIGAFVSFDVAEFASQGGTVGDKPVPGEVLQPAIHGWATFGVRGVFELWNMAPVAPLL